MNSLKSIIILVLAFLLVSLACGSEESEPEPTDEVLSQEEQEPVEESIEPVDEPVEPTEVPAEEPTPEPTDIPEPTETPEPTATPILGLVKPGTHLVGSDIQPGIYQGLGGEDILDSCYWGRMSDLSGEFDSIIANDNAVGQFYVEVLDTDMALETGCELIELEYAPTMEIGNVLPPGTYIIGRDIQPGTFQGQAGEEILDSCYWVRLSDLSGEFDSIIANDNAVGQFYVEVSENDFAFNTGCQVERVGD